MVSSTARPPGDGLWEAETGPRMPGGSPVTEAPAAEGERAP